MTKMNTKNNAIVIWRIIFTYMIMIFHFDNKYGISQHFDMVFGWYIGVEFFFIVSGYLLYTGMDKLSKKYHSGWDYLLHRYRKIYPYYLGAFLFSLICNAVTSLTSLKDILKVFLEHYFEMFALHGIGLGNGWSNLNNTSWFISIMFIGGFIIFHCLIKWRDNFCNFIVPLMIMIFYSYIYRNLHSIGAVVEVNGFYENMPLMRGLAGMGLGIIAARMNEYILKNCQKTKWIRLAGILGFSFVILGSLVYGNSKKDYLYAIVLTISVAIGFLPSKSQFLQSRLLQKWSGLTMSMYFVHDAFRTFIFPSVFGFTDKLSMKVSYLILYLISVTISALIFDYVIKFVLKIGNKMMIRITGMEN